MRSLIKHSSLFKNAISSSSIRCYHSSLSTKGGASHHHEGEHHDEHHDHHHEEPYTDNDGRLFGIPAGEQYKARGWEKRFFPFIYGSVLMLVIGLMYKPDYSMQTWAKEEALRRRAARSQQKQQE